MTDEADTARSRRSGGGSGSAGPAAGVLAGEREQGARYPWGVGVYNGSDWREDDENR